MSSKQLPSGYEIRTRHFQNDGCPFADFGPVCRACFVVHGLAELNLARNRIQSWLYLKGTQNQAVPVVCVAAFSISSCLITRVSFFVVNAF